jgi:hypothetical protein
MRLETRSNPLASSQTEACPSSERRTFTAVEPQADAKRASLTSAIGGVVDSSALSLLRSGYPAFADALLRPLLEVICVARRICGGDIERFQVLLLIALRTTAHEDFAKLSYEQISSGEAKHYPSLGITVQSIADASGLPKETVRRKVNTLIDNGWVIREDNGLRFSPEASPGLLPVRDAVLRLALNNHDLVSQYLKDPAGFRASKAQAHGGSPAETNTQDRQ